MTVTDPRDAYDDLRTSRTVEPLDADAFADWQQSEAESGWVTTGVVVDERGRLLLIYDDAVEAWMAPGGTRKPGESLPDCLRREIREETGVRVEPERPHVVHEAVRRHDDRRPSFTVVTYTAEPIVDDPTPPDPDALPEVDPEISNVEWMSQLPEQT